MTAAKVRAEYEALQQMAQTFGKQADSVRKSMGAIRSAKDALEGGAWKGRGATKFYQEINGSVLPGLKRLVTALERASETTKKISQIMQQAEKDASSVLKDDDPMYYPSVMPPGHSTAGLAAAGEPSMASAAVMPPGYSGAGPTTGTSGGAADGSAEVTGDSIPAPESAEASGDDVSAAVEQAEGESEAPGDAESNGLVDEVGQTEDGASDGPADEVGLNDQGSDGGQIEDFPTTQDDGYTDGPSDGSVTPGDMGNESLIDEVGAGDTGSDGGPIEDFPTIEGDGELEGAGDGPVAPEDMVNEGGVDGEPDGVYGVAGGVEYDGLGNRLVP